MLRDYDNQLLESVAVRRRRVRDALLFGTRRSRRTFDENLTKLFGGLVIAALLCAGCTGWSFLQGQLREQRATQERIDNPPTVTATTTTTTQPTVPGGYATGPVYPTQTPPPTLSPQETGQPSRHPQPPRTSRGAP